MTSAAETLVDAKLLARLARLGVKVRQAMEGGLTGQHKSPHHGASVEFAQHREYSPGDEIKHIDWKAFAKSDRDYIKQFEDETNLRTYLCVDVSGSMAYQGSRGTESKQRYAAQLAAILGWLLLRQGDAVGLLTFGEAPAAYVPPRARPDHYWHLARTLAETPALGPTRAVRALERIAEVAARRSLVVLITDGFEFDEPGRLAALARQLRRRHHRVVVFQVLDPDEVDFPFKDLTIFEDMEVDARLLADPRGMRATYLDELRAFCDGFKRSLLEGDVAYHRVVTDLPVERAVAQVLGAPT